MYSGADAWELQLILYELLNKQKRGKSAEDHMSES